VKPRIVPFALAALIFAGGITVSMLAVRPSCPDGTYRNGSGVTVPTEAGPMPNLTPCTSYATHLAPSSGTTIPLYATGLDTHPAERWWIVVASLLVGVGAAGRWFVRERRRSATVAV
jgi:hypothetical protein